MQNFVHFLKFFWMHTDYKIMYLKILNILIVIQKSHLKLEDDNPRQFDCISIDVQMSKILSLIGPELQCPQVSYLFHFGFLDPHYFLQEISNTTFSRKFRRNIGPSLLLQEVFWILVKCKTYCNQISIWN